MALAGTTTLIDLCIIDRISAVEALGELNDTRAVEPLINGLNGVYADPYAALGLALLNDPKGIAAESGQVLELKDLTMH